MGPSTDTETAARHCCQDKDTSSGAIESGTVEGIGHERGYETARVGWRRRRPWALVGILIVCCALGITPSASAVSLTFVTLDVPGATWTEPNGINAAGDIVGDFRDAGGYYDASLRTAGGYLQDNCPPGARLSLTRKSTPPGTSANPGADSTRPPIRQTMRRISSAILRKSPSASTPGENVASNTSSCAPRARTAWMSD